MREFDLLGFAAFLGEVGVAVEIENRHALKEAAEIVETEAKRVIGTYDYNWPQLADATKQDRLRQGFSENEPGLRSGEMRDSIEHSVGRDEAQVGSDNDKLVWFELGTVKQPPRSVLMQAAVHKESEVVEAIGRRVMAQLSGSATKLIP